MPDSRTFSHLSGQDLAALRREEGLTQAELARRAGIGRQSIIFWEKRSIIDPWSWAPRRMLEVLGVRVVPPTMSYNGTSTRAGGWGVTLG